MDDSSQNRADWGNSYFFDFEGINFSWRFLGDRDLPPIVFVHGFGASSKHWRFNAKQFCEAGYCVYALDLIGFGDSDQPGPSKKIRLNNLFWSKQLNEFLEKVVKVTSVRKVVLIGNSLGSLVALTSAATRPDLISALIAAPLPDQAFLNPIKNHKSKIFNRVKTFLVTLFFNVFPLEILVFLISRTILIKQAIQIAYYSTIKEDRELIRLINQPSKRANASRSLRAMCIGMSLRSKEITAPFLLNQLSSMKYGRPACLLLWGSEDKLVPLKIGKKIISDYPWISFFVLDKTGHCPHDESPVKFNRLILSWLEIHLSINRENL